jgi:hypothetical protein
MAGLMLSGSAGRKQGKKNKVDINNSKKTPGGLFKILNPRVHARRRVE